MTRLALVMIARDEAHAIARALASARPHVDRMIVLDTGSLDETAAIAAAAGAEVHSFTWIDDFSAARNAALAQSDAAWNLVLDADEWIAGGAEALKDLPVDGSLGLVRLDNQTDTPGREAASAWLPRLLPRGVRYEGRVHEQPVGAARSVRTGLILGHDGYTAANLERKAGRNEALLMAELQAAPEDGYLWYQLAREHQVRDRPPQAALCFAEALRLAPLDTPWRHSLVVRALTAFKTAGQLDQALELAGAEIPRWPNSPDFYFALGDLYLECANQAPERAASDFLPIVESAWQRCLEIGEQPDLDGSVPGRGGHMAAHNLAVFYETLGQTERAAQHYALAETLKAGRTG
ncbi:glycosyltransferase [Phenylobacterium sp.]|uniref:glycosyltransferase n=1 Tax=Phenylobacterium sp. TaxID=1871053 RepID=UPI0011F47416|nr:glycosyltransferase [Phenylobacterium sp.]TAL28464.1 MAG: glycosyltransferase [Phenylobacterium sp.]